MEVDPYPDEKEMKYVILDYVTERHWRLIFEENYGGVDYQKLIIHSERWDVYMNEKKELIKGGFSEVSGFEGKKVIWEVVNDRVVEEVKYHDEIGLQGLDFNLFDEDKDMVFKEGLSEYTFLSMLMNLPPGYWNNQLKRMIMKVDEDNGK